MSCVSSRPACLGQLRCHPDSWDDRAVLLRLIRHGSCHSLTKMDLVHRLDPYRSKLVQLFEITCGTEVEVIVPTYVHKSILYTYNYRIRSFF